MTRVFGRLLLVLISTTLGLGLVELGVRILKPEELPGKNYSAHPIFHHRLPPDATIHDHNEEARFTVTTNHLGLRGPNPAVPKPAGVRRLLVLGDSFTLGVGVQEQETFCARLQQRFTQRHAPVEVINAGTGSYSPILHYVTMRDLYLPLQPDAVLLVFDFNDLSDDAQYERHLRYDAQGRVTACDPDYVNGRLDAGGLILRHSALAHFLHRKLIRTFERIQILGLRQYLQVKLSGGRTKIAVVQADPEKTLAHDTLFMIRDRSRLPIIERRWQVTGGFILKIRDLLQERGIPFALAVFPQGVQVGPQQWAKGRVELGFEAGRTYDDPFAFDFIAAFARKEHIPLMNTWPAFVRTNTQPLFYDWDGHFTPAGQRVMAEALFEDRTLQELVQ